MCICATIQFRSRSEVEQWLQPLFRSLSFAPPCTYQAPQPTLPTVMMMMMMLMTMTMLVILLPLFGLHHVCCKNSENVITHFRILNVKKVQSIANT